MTDVSASQTNENKRHALRLQITGYPVGAAISRPIGYRFVFGGRLIAAPTVAITSVSLGGQGRPPLQMQEVCFVNSEW